MLSGSLTVHGEAAEQIGGTQDIRASPRIVAGASLLYWDAGSETPKPGFRGKGAGSVRRFPVILKQFKLTHDVDAMTPEQIVALLPAEFDRWRAPRPSSVSEQSRRRGLLGRHFGRPE